MFKNLLFFIKVLMGILVSIKFKMEPKKYSSLFMWILLPSIKKTVLDRFQGV